MRTIRDLDQAGMDLRLWCYRCERAAIIDGIIWMEFEERGWDLEVEAARQRFRCRQCRSNRDVLIVTTKRRTPLPAPTSLGVAYFHMMRSKRRRPV